MSYGLSLTQPVVVHPKKSLVPLTAVHLEDLTSLLVGSVARDHEGRSMIQSLVVDETSITLTAGESALSVPF